MGVEQPRIENVLAHLSLEVAHLAILAGDKCITSNVVGFMPTQIRLLSLVPLDPASSSEIATIFSFALSLLLLNGLLLLLHSKHVHELVERDPFHGRNLRHRRVILIEVVDQASAEQ